MVTLNKSKSVTHRATVQKEVTQNAAGAVAYKLQAVDSLVERVLGAFWSEDLFYTKGGKTAKDTVENIKAVLKTDPKFVLQLAAFARNDMNLRTTPQVLLVQAANFEGSKQYIKEYAPKIIKRADELADVIAYQLSEFGKPIPNSLKKGLAIAFANFDEYQLNKYDSDKSSVKLGDVLRLIYRKADYPVSKAMYNYLVNDEVDAEALPKIGALKALLAKDKIDAEAKDLIKKSSITWESLTSKFGSSKEVWKLAIPNMGYMALLRNLRNFENADADLLPPVLQIISDPERVKRSKQLPFRFYSAYKNTTNSLTKRAIAQAFEASVSNVSLPGRTGVIIDLSGSMSSALSGKSSLSYRDVASVMGAIATKKAVDSVVVGFADFAKVISLNPDDTMMSNIGKIARTSVGSSTYANKGFQALGGEKLDRIILISDMQCYTAPDSSISRYWGETGVHAEWKKYVAKNPKSKLYSLDVAAYGTKQVPSVDNNAFSIDGWSDKLFDFIALSEKKDIMQEEIRKW